MMECKARTENTASKQTRVTDIQEPGLSRNDTTATWCPPSTCQVMYGHLNVLPSRQCTASLTSTRWKARQHLQHSYAFFVFVPRQAFELAIT
ncbi:hypothetical protein PISMIDRAFT_689861 [Pisolithus microcarpus 441]|uniref:Uncharacterized protein n=1 Tax=Pisolithus microcarpus 441 TaxID=765257 RepID=A0A0C9Y4V2_9AGAM|nr:hypothetical protein PISMIDRAFT_689861 [Pisolithus microcarpus 441]